MVPREFPRSHGSPDFFGLLWFYTVLGGALGGVAWRYVFRSMRFGMGSIRFHVASGDFPRSHGTPESFVFLWFSFDFLSEFTGSG